VGARWVVQACLELAILLGFLVCTTIKAHLLFLLVLLVFLVRLCCRHCIGKLPEVEKLGLFAHCLLWSFGMLGGSTGNKSVKVREAQPSIPWFWRARVWVSLADVSLSLWACSSAWSCPLESCHSCFPFLSTCLLCCLCICFRCLWWWSATIRVSNSSTFLEH
jgi:hypothetical protein